MPARADGETRTRTVWTMSPGHGQASGRGCVADMLPTAKPPSRTHRQHPSRRCRGFACRHRFLLLGWLVFTCTCSCVDGLMSLVNAATKDIRRRIQPSRRCPSARCRAARAPANAATAPRGTRRSAGAPRADASAGPRCRGSARARSCRRSYGSQALRGEKSRWARALPSAEQNQRRPGSSA